MPMLSLADWQARFEAILVPTLLPDIARAVFLRLQDTDRIYLLDDPEVVALKYLMGELPVKLPIDHWGNVHPELPVPPTPYTPGF